MTWSTWSDSYEEREEYMFTVHNLIPATGGMWGQPMFTLKYTSCEDPTRDGCPCTGYEEKHKSGLEFTKGGVWSQIMAFPDEKLMSTQDVHIFTD